MQNFHKKTFAAAFVEAICLTNEGWRINQAWNENAA
jgi:hypothetical protein